MKPYYYVYNTSGTRSTHKYKTLECAVKEAEAMAELHPALAFEVLQCVAISSAPKPHATTFYLDTAPFKKG
jgi:hypothetical protein